MLSTAVSAWAADQQLVIDGFRLGMSKSEASKIKPEIAWRTFMSSSAQKEFPSVYGGLPARIKITLDGQGLAVASIGIIVAAKEEAACSQAAKQGLQRLEASLGKPMHVITDQPLPRALWMSATRVTTTWFNSCANQPPEYIVTHTQAAR